MGYVSALLDGLCEHGGIAGGLTGQGAELTSPAIFFWLASLAIS